MKNEKCPIMHKCLTYWHEVLGLALLVIATVLTIMTGTALGILAMFFAGAIICCGHHHGRCDCPCHSDHDKRSR